MAVKLSKVPAESRYKRLYALGDVVVAELKTRLQRGELPKALAEWLHAQGLAPEIKLESLEKQLVRFRRDEVFGSMLMTLQTAASKYRGKQKIELLQKVDVLKEMHDLCQIQHARLEKAYNTEKQNPALLMLHVSEAVRDYSKILKDLSLLYLEMGLLPRAPKQVRGMLSDPQGNATMFAFEEQGGSLYAETKAALRELQDMDDDSADSQFAG